MNATDPWDPEYPAPDATRRTAPRWVLVVGLVLFGTGALFTILGAAVPYFSDGQSQGWFYQASMILTPIGFLVSLGYGIFGALPPRKTT